MFVVAADTGMCPGCVALLNEADAEYVGCWLPRGVDEATWPPAAYYLNAFFTESLQAINQVVRTYKVPGQRLCTSDADQKELRLVELTERENLSSPCNHTPTLVTVIHTNGGYRAQCLHCSLVGPERESPETAYLALRKMRYPSDRNDDA